MAGPYPHQPPHHYHQPHHPHAMGYPPVMGYPPGNPPPPYPQNYSPYHNYASAPPMAPHPHAGYYPNPNYLPAHAQPVRQSVSSRFARGVVIAFIFLIVFSAMLLIFDVFRNRPEKPIYRLAAFSVTNFNISNAILMGNWEAKVIVENRCDSFKISLDRFQSSIYHQNPADSLAWIAEWPLSLDAKANTTITLRSSMINSSQPKRPMVWERPLKILCQDIKVGFAAGSTNGTLVIDKPKECSISW
ncbi:hypothetical protein CRG98_031351 [Punica granatum]|uniref:Late embryogenesis abundant protein LEA-2 subgroup domain-containing protein n=1 Tax=Punica granatum TaxID=22663 RepID=A0A2I0IW65_PUNGR|nr:hypothetical protein CRG98_031351 [Punica granatum]